MMDDTSDGRAPEYQSATDLFGRFRLIKKEGIPLNERAGLIKYFHERATDRLDEKYDVSYIGMILAHLNLRDLYYLQSICEDTVKRGGSWNKTFFGSIKAKSLTPTEPR